MGEVYRAHDTRLKRDVALKILPETFATDPDRLARFQREAEVLASLNHPNVAAIYGIEESPAEAGHYVRALVMELVEGPTLADRIAQRPIPIDEGLPIAKQIAEALEAAHEQGIIHRDLKPANVKVRPDGTVKILDFGLAKLAETKGSAITNSTLTSHSPTITSPALMTGAGVLLGTAAYMSPEQAKGRPADRRSDIWAFGCVLYEMLSGRAAFQGESLTETFAAVLRSEPDWSALPAAMPAGVRTLLTLCLSKESARQIASMSVVRFLLDNIDADPASSMSGAPLSQPPATRKHFWAWAVALASVVTATTVVWQSQPRATPQPARLTVVPPSAQQFHLQGFFRNLDISPDGARIVYVAGSNDNTRLMVRALDRLEAVALRGGTNAAFPFMSPDGRWVGFFTDTANSGELKKVSIEGGQPITICRYDGPPRGATWGDDGTIVFATRQAIGSRVSTGLLRVSADGGEPASLTTPDDARREDHLFPSMLPGGRALLFTVMSDYDVNTAEIALLDLTTGQRKTLIRGASDAQYVEGGYVVYASAGALYAVRFDPGRLEIVGEPARLAEQVATLTSGAANFRASRDTLVYVSGQFATTERSLVWVTRDGREEPLNAPTREYVNARLSPDATRLAVVIGNGPTADLWLLDLARDALTRLTRAGWLSGGTWMPDARRVVVGTGSGATALAMVAADGAVVDALKVERGSPSSVSGDGRSLLLGTTNAQTGADIAVLHLDDEPPRLELLLQTDFEEEGAELSPDGRWLAYYSNESGRNEVYVRPFPQVGAGRWQISTQGGSKPAWSADGRELFFLGPEGAMMRVGVQTTPTFNPGTPAKLFDGSSWYSAFAVRQYDVSRDAQRFIMIKNAAINQTSVSPNITVLLNWQGELARIRPTN
jgi:serine/threonine-protein kinase